MQHPVSPLRPPSSPSPTTMTEVPVNQHSWQPIGQTSNQLILYHPPSHALSVQPHPPGPVPGPSRLPRPPLLLAPAPLSPGTTSDIPENLCPYCCQPLPPPHPYPTSETPIKTPYFRILEQAHEGSRPPSPRLRASSPSPAPTIRPDDEEGEDDTRDVPSKGYYERFFREEGRLGMGAEGSVYLATHVIGGNILGTYAVKKIAVGTSKDYLVRMLREVRLLESLRHQNIIPYHHAWIEPTRFSSFGPPINALHVLMMYATAGNLDTFLLNRSYGDQPRPDLSASGLADQDSLSQLPKAERIKAFKKRRASVVAMANANGAGGASKAGAGAGAGADGVRWRRQENRGILFLGLDEIVRLFEDVVEGLAFLHSNSILHLDLKCSNVLLHWVEGDLIPRAMISDFGTSEEMLKGKRERSGHTGTMEYMAPETLTMDERGAWRPSDSHADMWSTGMILYKMIFLHMPYSDVEDFSVLHAEILRYPGFIPTPELIKACERRHTPRDMLLLLSRLVNTNPEARPSADKVRLGLRGLKASFPATRRASTGSVVARFTRPFVGLGEMVRGVGRGGDNRDGDGPYGNGTGTITDTQNNTTATTLIASPVRTTLALPPTHSVYSSLPSPSDSPLPSSFPSASSTFSHPHPHAHILDPIHDPSYPTPRLHNRASYFRSLSRLKPSDEQVRALFFATKIGSLHPQMLGLLSRHVDILFFTSSDRHLSGKVYGDGGRDEDVDGIPIVMAGLLVVMALGSMSLRKDRWQVGMWVLHVGIVVGWLRM